MIYFKELWRKAINKSFQQTYLIFSIFIVRRISTHTAATATVLSNTFAAILDLSVVPRVGLEPTQSILTTRA